MNPVYRRDRRDCGEQIQQSISDVRFRYIIYALEIPSRVLLIPDIEIVRAPSVKLDVPLACP